MWHNILLESWNTLEASWDNLSLKSKSTADNNKVEGKLDYGNKYWITPNPILGIFNIGEAKFGVGPCQDHERATVIGVIVTLLEYTIKTKAATPPKDKILSALAPPFNNFGDTDNDSFYDDSISLRMLIRDFCRTPHYSHIPAFSTKDTETVKKESEVRDEFRKLFDGDRSKIKSISAAQTFFMKYKGWIRASIGDTMDNAAFEMFISPGEHYCEKRKGKLARILSLCPNGITTFNFDLYSTTNNNHTPLRDISRNNIIQAIEHNDPGALRGSINTSLKTITPGDDKPQDDDNLVDRLVPKEP